MKTDRTDVLIVGAGAAGLFAAIWAGRTHPGRRILLLDGAKPLGAKILVAGGGRCNITHDVVSEDAYAGSSRNAIRKVLKHFDVPQTILFFEELGVELKREESGKFFPVSDSARTVLDALLAAVRYVGAEIQHPRRVEQIERTEYGFRVGGTWGALETSRLVLATGGMSLPKSGSDGHGYHLARSLGHSITPRVFPALVPLILPPDHFLRTLSGISAPARLEVRSVSGKLLAAFTGSTLCTHFGLSGPPVLDISRYYIDAALDDPAGTRLLMNWLPDLTPESFEQILLSVDRISVGRLLRDWLPERLARGLCLAAAIEPQTPVQQLTREARRALIRTVTQLSLPIVGNRGFTYAEVTAGGIPLSEIRLETMESRLCPGLHLCGEICDVDGRIGGYNFQWAWSSGYAAGVSV
jgi:hypothetical protein